MIAGALFRAALRRRFAVCSRTVQLRLGASKPAVKVSL